MKKDAHNFRAKHRAAAHESAHALGDEAVEAPPDDPLIPRGEVPLIATNDDLAELLGHVRSQGQFAYDSEFIGELTYLPKLCLIQVATSQRVALIDPLADIDLNPFWTTICDPAIEKIVHAGEQDVEPVFRLTRQRPANIFDTQIAAGFAGMAYPVSLSKLVYEMVGARLGKGLTFSHWDQRPLSSVQMRYAADDVRYLPAIRNELGRRLDALGHADFAKQECEHLCEPTLYQFDPQKHYLRVRGASGLPPQNVAVLRELTIVRDAGARESDVPPRTFLRDEVLLEMARNPVRSIDKLARIRGLPRPVENTYGEQLVDATLRALALPKSEWPIPKPQEDSPTERFRADALWSAVQAISAGQGIDPALVSSRQEMTDVARHLKNGAEPTLDLFQGWRRKAVGDKLLGMIRGDTEVRLGWKNGALNAL